MMNDIYDVLVVGAGPAGLTAALYAGRAGKSVIVFEKEVFGGQITYSPKVENYPGIPEVSGNEFAETLLSQISALGVSVRFGSVSSIRIADGDGVHDKIVTVSGKEYSARTVIIASGSRHRPLGVEREEELVGAGVSYCAVCDGGFYKNGVTAVVGGGDSALQEALLLSDICRTVYLIHRRDAFRGDAEKQARLFARENVKVLTPMEIAGFLTEDGSLRALRLKNTATGEETELGVDCLFVSVGQQPELERFAALLPLTAQGYAAVPETGETPVRGVFVAGDCRGKRVRQLATAVSDGANAALAACRYLDGEE